MGLLIGFLTVVLVLNCLLLILLVLIQLPKKEAGAGIAFGGGATDALFGAGSGNALTKITKYSAGIFIGMSLVLAVLNTSRAARSSRSIEEELLKRQAAPAARATTNAPVSPAAPVLTPPPEANTPAATNAPPSAK